MLFQQLQLRREELIQLLRRTAGNLLSSAEKLNVFKRKLIAFKRVMEHDKFICAHPICEEAVYDSALKGYHINGHGVSNDAVGVIGTLENEVASIRYAFPDVAPIHQSDVYFGHYEGAILDR